MDREFSQFLSMIYPDEEPDEESDEEEEEEGE